MGPDRARVDREGARFVRWARVGDHVGVAAVDASEREWVPGWPISLARTMSPLRRGRGDPTLRIGPDEVWWATRTPAGVATLHLRLDRGTSTGGNSAGAVLARAWGPGRQWAIDALPRTLGADDDPTGFDRSANPVVTEAFDRFGATFRILRTERVLESLVPAILEQRVTGQEARRSWRTLVTRFGEPAPGPTPNPMWVPPEAATWARVPSWEWHRAGVDPGRARSVQGVALRAEALERLSALPAAEAQRRMRSLPGIGVWTSAEVAMRAWGDADALPFGDFHLAKDVVWALTGRRNGTDDELAELLAPWAGHRLRAARVVLLAGGHQPSRGPRAAITDHRRR